MTEDLVRAIVPLGFTSWKIQLLCTKVSAITPSNRIFSFFLHQTLQNQSTNDYTHQPDPSGVAFRPVVT
ncbi:hypothetical protein PM082_007060 [Marasmius tenuissimus]|nr:hypothetical protein PM082_007060 [Marasmius tenuissimus]